MTKRNFNTIPEALVALKKGKIILVTDDPDRENEGDMICAAEFATTENVNLMASLAKGLICQPMSISLGEHLGLSQMVINNTDNHETAFTESIDHITTTTGISAVERGVTTRATIDPDAKPSDFRRPGHVFPLISKPHGVLERQGHTEATVDLMNLAGLKPSGLCCEVMREDGTMMRTDELFDLAERYDMPFITIEDLIEYRRKNEKFVEQVASANLPTRFGDFKIYGYINLLNNEHHVALVKGDIDSGSPVLCRVHSECLTGDAFGSLRCDCGPQMQSALKAIADHGSGVLLYLRQEGRGIGLINKIKAYALQDTGLDTVEANHALGFATDLRDYSIGVQILKDLGIHKIRLMTNNPDKIESLEKYGLEIVERVPLIMPVRPESASYIQAKIDKMQHLIPQIDKE